MRIYDVSVPLHHQMPTYPGDPGIEINDWLSLANGDPANVSLLHFGAHTGTHVDAPAHFIAGASRVDSLPLEILIGPALVIEVPATLDRIDRAFIEGITSSDYNRILFKTRNSQLWQRQGLAFQENYVYLTHEAALALLERGTKLVGIDYLSVEGFNSNNFLTHLALLENEVIILEGLDLSGVPPGEYELICLPLKIAGGAGDGAPARAVLRTLE